MLPATVRMARSGTSVARAESVIVMSGYRLGLFEIENVLTAPSSAIVAAGVGVPGRLYGGTHR